VRGGSEAARAAAYSSYFAYCGTYEVSGDTIVHRVAMSLLPNWVGSSQTRYFEVNGDDLLLRTPPIEIGGMSLVNEFRWHREE
jgi:Lipocalin-like domain